MPLQIMIAVFLALAIWAGKTESGPEKPEKPENITIKEGIQHEELIIEDMSNMILITAIEHSSHRYTIMAQPKGGESRKMFFVNAANKNNETIKNHKCTIYRAA